MVSGIVLPLSMLYIWLKFDFYSIDAEDSFPTGAIRKTGRVFMHPDLVNLQLLDGVLFNTKYLIILRNITVSYSQSHREVQMIEILYIC
jgi:hypothetical protein